MVMAVAAKPSWNRKKTSMPTAGPSAGGSPTKPRPSRSVPMRPPAEAPKASPKPTSEKATVAMTQSTRFFSPTDAPCSARVVPISSSRKPPCMTKTRQAAISTQSWSTSRAAGTPDDSGSESGMLAYRPVVGPA
jgi:hypothetical protein